MCIYPSFPAVHGVGASSLVFPGDTDSTPLPVNDATTVGTAERCILSAYRRVKPIIVAQGPHLRAPPRNLQHAWDLPW